MYLNYIMGSKNTKFEPLLPVENIEKRTPEQLKNEEHELDQYERDCLEQHRVIQDMLINDEIEYKKDLDEYRKANGGYVVKSRALILRGEELQVRRSIVWD
jgi:hypothetical protein